MYDMLKEFIKPELLILIPVLYLIGSALKKSSFIDKKIPYLLGLFGVCLTLLYLLPQATVLDWKEVITILFTGVTQGILLAGASVYVNQLVKQAGKES